MRDPLYVVIAAGSYHSKSLVCFDRFLSRCRRRGIINELYRPIVQIMRFPIRIITGIEGTVIGVEFITKDEDPFVGAIHP